MKEEKVRIQNELGMHARAAACFAQKAAEYSSDIEVIKGQMQVNGKSIMELLTLAAANGCEITIRASGADETPALEALSILVNDGFGEN